MRSTKLISRRFRASVKVTIKAMAVLACLVVLTACAGQTPPPQPEVVYMDVPVPVATGCLSGERPAKPQTLKERYPSEVWKTKPPGAKSEAVKAQAGRRLNYETSLQATTSGCK